MYAAAVVAAAAAEVAAVPVAGWFAGTAGAAAPAGGSNQPMNYNICNSTHPLQY